MYFIPGGLENKKSKYRFKRKKEEKKWIKPYDHRMNSCKMRSKEFGYMTGRRIEAVRKTLVKLLSVIKIRKVEGEKRRKGRSIKIKIKRKVNLKNVVTRKGILTRMGKGKGKIIGWYTNQRAGVSLFDYGLDGLSYRRKRDINSNNFMLNNKRVVRSEKRSWMRGAFSSRLPFRCKLYVLNYNLTYNHKKKIRC